MSEKEKFEDLACKVGRLVMNFLTIEMITRMAIETFDKGVVSANRSLEQLFQVEKGDKIEWNALTNGDSLKPTLEKYNNKAPEEYKINNINKIINLRDALAHGRMFGYESQVRRDNLRLLKFERTQQDGKVVVVLAQDMTDSWLDEKIEMLREEVNKIRKAIDYISRKIN